ncbi:MAG: D-aminoacyl-tRNA deacylase [Polaromonas sp.]|jgi:D-tyrosyl-tRNA(Tyr) deacylase|uniref:D-aminoacyl-tRNA deacylase n=1 Tax=Polaromonas sp. TaxID=1869339 RepID=UPI002731B6A1|nr:D-aminoacyl-tRNA deacylase [Polaromonas sp.]MDP2255263.1 D-aminoacyl-tRNA deacylase [Polaromonas sp.]MDP3706687.1 D-aminoacyl-tRNA deacylase [Polaromonas sp.]
MKAVLQRVAQARVEIAGETVGQIEQGLLVLVCAERGDTEVQADKLLAKLLKLRIFSDGPGAGPPQARPAPSGGSVLHEVKSMGVSQPGKMNRSVQDLDGQGACGGLLIVSQFTLAADVSGGNRPSFTDAAPPEEGRRLYDYLVARARAAHPLVATGQFGADMQVHLVNDGPVTIPLRIVPGA